MRGAQRLPTGIHHENGIAARRISPIDHIAGKNPGMAGCDAARSFPIDTNSRQVFSLTANSYAATASTLRSRILVVSGRIFFTTRGADTGVCRLETRLEVLSSPNIETNLDAAA